MKTKTIKARRVEFRYKHSKGKDYLTEIAIIIPIRKDKITKNKTPKL